MNRSSSSRPLRIVTALVAVVSLVAVVARAVPQVEISRIVAGAVVLVFIIAAAIAMRSSMRRTSMKNRLTRRGSGGCKLCGLDPSVDDSESPAPKGRCIECGRATTI